MSELLKRFTALVNFASIYLNLPSFSAKKRAAKLIIHFELQNEFKDADL